MPPKFWMTLSLEAKKWLLSISLKSHEMQMEMRYSRYQKRTKHPFKYAKPICNGQNYYERRGRSSR
jgi:hypothetical protein